MIDRNKKQIRRIPDRQKNEVLFSGGLEWLQMMAVAVVAAVLLLTFVFRVVTVEGSSMAPSFLNGDRVLVLSSLWAKPKDGDVVVFRKESFLQDPVIKRVIATEGQTVDIHFDTGEVVVDGKTLKETYIADVTHAQGDLQFPMTISEGCVFVMGDNRNESTDSRWSCLGEIDTRYILGTAKWIFFPAGGDMNRMGGVN